MLGALPQRLAPFGVGIGLWVGLPANAIALEATPLAIAQVNPPDARELVPLAPDPTEQTIPAPPDFPVPRPALDLQLEFPDPGEPPAGGVPSDFQVRVQRVEVLGSTVLQAEIAALTSAIENQDVTFADLLQLRADITRLYIDNGYITSGAFLPTNQNLTDGIVQIQVIEGQLEAIEISGLTRLREGYVLSRVGLATGAPLNQHRLESALQLLQLDPLLSTVNAELTAGRAPGQNILLLNLDEAPAFLASLSVDNYRPPSIGSVQGVGQVVHNNVLGFGDRLSASYSLGQGLNLYDVSYEVPISPQGGSVSLGFNNSDSRIVEDVFRDLGIRSESQTLSLGVRQPLMRTPQNEFALGLTLDLRHSQSFILEDIPFSFSLGPEAGRSRVAALRFSQDWVQRYPRRVLAARSQFSLGLDAFDATINDLGIDGRFFSWLGQVQWVEQIAPTVLLISRVNAQLTSDVLLPLERFSLGGISTVRGYEENQVVADSGLTAGVEALISLSNPPGQLQLNPFLELGTGWNNRGPNPDPSTLASVGVGLRWLLAPGLRFRGDYGIPLIAVNSQSNSLQSSGFYFSLTFEPTTLLRSAD